MPELPEAEITKRKLAALLGKRAFGFWSDWPRSLRITRNASVLDRDIKGMKVIKIRRHGKVIFFGLSDRRGHRQAGGRRLLAFHQRMSGALFLKSQTEKFPPHVHHRVIFYGGEELLFRDPRKFGIVWYGLPEKVMADSYLVSLGPDMLSVSAAEFKRYLAGRSGMIKSLLLRQDIFSGIGNIIADESLWLAKIHPKRVVASLLPSDLDRLYSATKKIIQKSILAQGTSMRDWGHPDGASGQFQNQFKVYGRAGELCGRCKRGKVARILTGGRGTWICPYCQHF